MWGRCGGDVGEMTRTSAQRHISIYLPTPPHISPYLARRRTSLSWRRRRPSSQARRGWLGLTLALPLALALTRTLTELAGKAGLAAQREAWAEVMDCGTELEGLLKGRANQVA